MNVLRKFCWFAGPLLAALVLSSCAQVPAPAAITSADATTSVVENTGLQRTFDSPAAATQALLDATKAGDHVALREMFGPELDQLLSGEPTQDAVEFDNFAKALAQMCNPVKEDDNKVVLYIGADNWPFPIPLVRADGQWHFDTAAGKQEILNRRIGKDELTAISVCQAYVDAQREYASIDRDGDGLLTYAQRLNSTPDHHDGLYWPPVEGEDLSPLGPLVADAHDQGYDADKPVGRTEPYNGYLFKILKEQGPDSPGGKYSYIINGNMIAGFALVAYPAHWGDSGVMTFIVNQEGKVYQCNLGADSARLGAAMTVFNPDKAWAEVKDDGIVVP